jgi:hypothetical protein
MWGAGYLLKEKILVCAGPYRFTRNPLYVGSILTDAAICVGAWSPWIPLAYFPIYLFVIYRRMGKEEQVLRGIFGAQFDEYCAKVGRLIPRLSAWPAKLANGTFNWYNLAKNREIPRVLHHCSIVLVLWLAADLRALDWNVRSLIARPHDVVVIAAAAVLIVSGIAVRVAGNQWLKKFKGATVSQA